MRQMLCLLAALAIAITGCSGETKLPVATGKGTMRAVNAIKASPTFLYRIEERQIGAAEYKAATNPSQFDDLDYVFNFDVQLAAADTELTRVASKALSVTKDTDYTFVISGNYDKPAITLWEAPTREWTGTETVFEARFAHTAASLAAIDVYFAPPDTPPAVDNLLGTLTFGEILETADFEAGEYVLTVTAAGDASTVHFVSETGNRIAQLATIFTIFDSDENDPSPHVVRAYNTSGASLNLADARFAPRLRFFHASTALATSDVYADETLTTPLISDHAFGDISGDLEVAAGLNALTYTAAMNVGSILFEAETNAIRGRYINFYVIGAIEELTGVSIIPDRRSTATIGKLTVFNAATNQDPVDIYIVEPDTDIVDKFPNRPRLSLGSDPYFTNLVPASYDIYLTAVDTQTIVSGPVRIDVAAGDVIDFIALDTVDPNVVDLQLVPAP
jgi:hypothetical protein